MFILRYLCTMILVQYCSSTSIADPHTPWTRYTCIRCLILEFLSLISVLVSPFILLSIICFLWELGFLEAQSRSCIHLVLVFPFVPTCIRGPPQWCCDVLLVSLQQFLYCLLLATEPSTLCYCWCFAVVFTHALPGLSFDLCHYLATILRRIQSCGAFSTVRALS